MYYLITLLRNPLKFFCFFSILFAPFYFMGCSSNQKSTQDSTRYSALSNKHKLPQLPYAYTDLEPYIDAQTMKIHHSKHHQAYVNNLNQSLKNTPWAKLPLKELMKDISKIPLPLQNSVRNNGGGHYNHQLFWQLLIPKHKFQEPSPQMKNVISQHFQSLELFKAEFTKAALSLFGSGWVWLILDENKKLLITTTTNQDNPLMDIIQPKGYPILALDVWEHAYYLKYQNQRARYVEQWWNIINWSEVEKRYLKCFEECPI